LNLADAAAVISSSRVSGKAGNIKVTTDHIDLTGGGVIQSRTFGRGSGGRIDITAEDTTMEGSDERTGFSGLYVSTDGIECGAECGNAGLISLKTKILNLSNGGTISAATYGRGEGGTINITSDDIAIKGTGFYQGGEYASGLFATSQGTDLVCGAKCGSGGDIKVNSEALNLSDSAVINASTYGSGGGGDVTISTEGLDITSSAQIAAGTAGAGKGGKLVINATNIKLSDKGAIEAISINNNTSAGKSGDIFITARNSLRLLDGSEISVQTEQADAGDINLNVGNLLHLRDGSSITTSVADGEGRGGNINIDPIFVVLDNNSSIIARAKEGDGGNINITADFLFKSPDSEISAASELGQSGTVTINSPDTNITGSITVLPETFLDAAALMRQHCAARTPGGRSSLVMSGGGGVQVEPGLSYLPATYTDASGENSGQPVAKSEENGGFFNSLPKATVPSLGGLAFGCNPI
jgi:large exoprotein involved in heme utilization and adhesion